MTVGAKEIMNGSKRLPSMGQLLKDLWKHLGQLKTISGVVLAVAVVVVLVLAGVFGGSADTRGAVAGGAGVVGTLLALLVALAIFSWSQTDSAATNDKLERMRRELRKRIERHGDFDPNEEGQPADAHASRVGDAMTLEGRRYVIAPAGEFSARWWARALGIAAAVADGDGQFSQTAHELLDVPFDDFKLVATLDQRQRGNRPVLMVTVSDDGEERIWSVFSGKGMHVKDVTSLAEVPDRRPI